MAYQLTLAHLHLFINYLFTTHLWDDEDGVIDLGVPGVIGLVDPGVMGVLGVMFREVPGLMGVPGVMGMEVPGVMGLVGSRD